MNKKLSTLLAGALITGLTAGSVAKADDGGGKSDQQMSDDKNGCKGKVKSKDSCKGKAMSKKKKDKNSCSGKNGCEGKDKDKGN